MEVADRVLVGWWCVSYAGVEAEVEEGFGGSLGRRVDIESRDVVREKPSYQPRERRGGSGNGEDAGAGVVRRTPREEAAVLGTGLQQPLQGATVRRQWRIAGVPGVASDEELGLEVRLESRLVGFEPVAEEIEGADALLSLLPGGQPEVVVGHRFLDHRSGVVV